MICNLGDPPSLRHPVSFDASLSCHDRSLLEKSPIKMIGLFWIWRIPVFWHHIRTRVFRHLMGHLMGPSWREICVSRHEFAGSLKSHVSLAEYPLFYRALFQKRPIILRSLLIMRHVCVSLVNPVPCHVIHVNVSVREVGGWGRVPFHERWGGWGRVPFSRI